MNQGIPKRETLISRPKIVDRRYPQCSESFFCERQSAARAKNEKFPQILNHKPRLQKAQTSRDCTELEERMHPPFGLASVDKGEIIC